MDLHICQLFAWKGESGESTPSMVFGKVLHQRAEAFQYHMRLSGGLACIEESLKCDKKEASIRNTTNLIFTVQTGILFKFQSNCEVGFIFSILEENRNRKHELFA